MVVAGLRGMAHVAFLPFLPFLALYLGLETQLGLGYGALGLHIALRVGVGIGGHSRYGLSVRSLGPEVGAGPWADQLYAF